MGFVKGVGQGMVSLPFRVIGGAWAVPGYAMKGLYQEMIKSKGKSVQNYIIAARIAQGYDEANKLSNAERDDIVRQWQIVKGNMKMKKNFGEEQMDSIHSLVNDKRKKKQDRWAKINAAFKGPGAQPSLPPATSQHGSSQNLPLSHTTSHGSVTSEPGPRVISGEPAWRTQARTQQHATFPQASSQAQVALERELMEEEEAERKELEAAIAASIASHSQGNAEEDQLMANAMRASIAELERVPVNATAEDEEAALKRALQASLSEAGKEGYSEQEQKQLEETIRKSLNESSQRRQRSSDSEWDSDSDGADNEEFQRIIAESKELAHLHEQHPEEYKAAHGAQESGIMGAIADATGANAAQSSNNEDDELKKALAESEKAHKEDMDKQQKQKTEEDIVMEYVRKQSLLEEEHRQRILQGRDTAGEGSGVAAGK